MSNSPVSRRSVAKGAAWSIPVVMVASPAMAMNGSPPPLVCPTVPGDSAWSLSASGGASAGTTTLLNGEFKNSKEGTRTTAYRATWTSTMEVQEGVTYTFDGTFLWGEGNGSTARSVPANGTFSVGGQQVFQGLSDVPPASTTSPWTGTYTATSTGPVTLTVTFVVSNTTSTRTAGDDIIFRLNPAIVCAGTPV